MTMGNNIQENTYVTNAIGGVVMCKLGNNPIIHIIFTYIVRSI